MDRRDFIKLCSIAGLGVAASGIPGTANKAYANDGRFYVFVHAVGGARTWLRETRFAPGRL